METYHLLFDVDSNSYEFWPHENTKFVNFETETGDDK